MGIISFCWVYFCLSDEVIVSNNWWIQQIINLFKHYNYTTDSLHGVCEHTLWTRVLVNMRTKSKNQSQNVSYNPARYEICFILRYLIVVSNEGTYVIKGDLFERWGMSITMLG